jgi:hypothetical protein
MLDERLNAAVVAIFAPFQKPQECRAAKYLNLDARRFRFPMFHKQLFLEQAYSIDGDMTLRSRVAAL